MHALPSTCSKHFYCLTRVRFARISAFPAFSAACSRCLLRSHPLSVKPRFRVRTVTRVSLPESAHRRAGASARPVRMQATGQDARGGCRAPLVSDQRCIERQHGDAMQRPHYNYSVLLSSTVVSIASFVFATFDAPQDATYGGVKRRSHHPLFHSARLPAVLSRNHFIAIVVQLRACKSSHGPTPPFKPSVTSYQSTMSSAEITRTQNWPTLSRPL
jgi:hypothetical protein